MDTADRKDKVHSVPVPERYLPLVYEVLADAHRAETVAGSGMNATPSVPLSKGDTWEWAEDEVVRAYRESSPKQRAAFEYLAENAGREVRSQELACAVYPDYDPDEAEGKIYGVLGAFGRRSAAYGKKQWFFDAHRERLDNGKRGSFVYEMSVEVAVWVRKASGRLDPE